MRQYALAAIVLVIGLIITWAASREAIRAAERDAVSNFERQADLYLERILGKLRNSLVAASDMDHYYQTGVEVGAGTFQRLVSSNSYFKQHSVFVGMVFEIKPNSRVVFTTMLKDAHDQELGIVQPVGAPDVEPEQTMFPLYFVWKEAADAKTSLVGLDLGGQPDVRTFLEEALEANKPSAIVLPPFPDLDAGNRNYILTANPVLSKNGLRGLIVQMLDFDRLRESSIYPRQSLGDDFVLEISTEWMGGQRVTTIAPREIEEVGGVYVGEEISLGAGTWVFTVFPKEDSININYRTPIITMSISLLLTGLFVFIFVTQTQRANRVAGIVKRRTRALKEAHEELEDHYRLLQKMNNDVEEARSVAELANKTKSEFLATMSHELRTPLNAILGFSQLLGEEALGPIGDNRYVEYARDIHGSGSHLLSLINDILDLAKLEAGQVKIEKMPVYVQPLVEKVMSLLVQQANDKGIEIYSEFAETMPMCIISDELRLRQILINLCSNAIKFTTEGSVVARLHAKQFKNGQEGWVLEVQDTGIGIPEDKQSTLFDRFTQVDAALSRRHGGVGLGLAICRELVDRMGGKISVRSISGIGTTIRVHLPLEEAMADTQTDENMI